MASEGPQIHVFFFPFMAHGHIIPLLSIAKLFASRGVKATIITTPANAPLFSKSIQRTQNFDIRILKFPVVEAGLPEGCENMDAITSHALGIEEMIMKFFSAISMLQEPLEQLLQECRPDCLVADACFPWTTNAAAKFGIPRLVFHATGLFSLCVAECMSLYQPCKKVSSDPELFVVPNLPGDIKLTRKELAFTQDLENGFTRLLNEGREAEMKSFGVVVNSFYELEPAYVDYFKQVLGRKAWNIGPLSLFNRKIEDKAEASIVEHECLKWLDSKNSNSVVYICFGSMANFSSAQLMEIAMGLEAAGQQFIWVVRKDKNDNGNEDWLPEGFEKRMEGKGLVIRGWAPQVLILDHEAIGGFVTHCGWNSTLEGLSSGLPMVTWPLSSDQFYNEKLLTQVLKIGVGVQQWVSLVGDVVKSENIEKAVKEIMVGDKAEEIRSRAKVLKEMAGRAIEKGGSSYSDLTALIEELSLRRH